MEKINESIAVVVQDAALPQRSFFDATPEEQVRQATEIANTLMRVVKAQGLSVPPRQKGGKDFLKVEAWQVVGTFFGVVPREKSVTRHADGSFEAYVELVRFKDGIVVGGGSSLCSRKERKWADAEDFAVRSMAITRATGKAFRLTFSWIISLAGYSTTPFEEMPEPESEKEEPEGQIINNYNGTTEQQQRVEEILKKKNFPEDKWPELHARYLGRPIKDLPKVMKEMGL